MLSSATRTRTNRLLKSAPIPTKTTKDKVPVSLKNYLIIAASSWPPFISVTLFIHQSKKWYCPYKQIFIFIRENVINTTYYCFKLSPLRNAMAIISGFPLFRTDKIPWYFHDFSKFFSKFPGIFFIIFKSMISKWFWKKYANFLSFIWTKN